jgi:hypothetical protein
MNDHEFTELTIQYIAATQARLQLIEAGVPVTQSELDVYRDLAEREWELGLAWDAELIRSIEG